MCSINSVYFGIKKYNMKYMMYVAREQKDWKKRGSLC